MTAPLTPALPWPQPEDFVWRAEEVTPPGGLRPTLLMFFHLECAGCVSRGIPFMKAVAAEYGGRVQFIAVHTSRGHRTLPREDVLPTLLHFASTFAKLPFPVALDLDGSLAAAYATEGTPHWVALEPTESGTLSVTRSIYGSQDNARTRLEYWLAEQQDGPQAGEQAGTGESA